MRQDLGQWNGGVIRLRHSGLLMWFQLGEVGESIVRCLPGTRRWALPTSVGENGARKVVSPKSHVSPDLPTFLSEYTI